MLLSGEMTRTLTLGFVDCFAKQNMTKHYIYLTLSKGRGQDCDDIYTACEKRLQSFDLLRFPGIYFRNREKLSCKKSDIIIETMYLEC